MCILLISGTACQLLARDSTQLDEAAARVSRVPMVVGDWQGQELDSDEAVFEQAGAKAYWTRTYVHRRTKESVLVILMCGRWGKISVHTPEVCYGGAGYELRDQPIPFTVRSAASDAPSQLWTAQFKKRAGVPTQLRLYWGWSVQEVWEASASPRWRFFGQPFVYKLYVSHNVEGQPNLTPQTDPAADFLRKFVPEMNRVLYAPEAG